MPPDTLPPSDPNPPRWQVSLGRWIALAAALISGGIPLATFIREEKAKEREIAVSKAQQEFATRTAYLDRAVDPARPPALRQAVLRFLNETSPDEGMRRWAEGELKIVDPEVAKLKAQIEQMDKQIEAANLAQAQAAKELIDLKQARVRDAGAIAEAAETVVNLRLTAKETEMSLAKKAAILTGASGFYNMPSFEIRTALGIFDGRIGRIMLSNSTSKRICVSLYHPDAPSQPHERHSLAQGDTWTFPAVYGNDWGIQVNDGRVVMIGRVADWDPSSRLFHLKIDLSEVTTPYPESGC